MENNMEQLISLCKRRGFVFPGSDIYGGLANTWDYGPYGVELKNNIKKLWWKTFVQDRSDVFGMESAILMNPRVWQASGHIAGFNDALIDCKKCKSRQRADNLIEENLKLNTEGKSVKELDDIIKSKKIKCPKCGATDWTNARKFNLLFKTFIGPVEDDTATVYLRGETAQGIFVNFKNILDTMHHKLPFGVAQIGKSFRNEITPGNFIFRTLEFEQMEIEYFIDPKSWKKNFAMWEKEIENWIVKGLGINKKNIKVREHSKEELSHYSKRTIDFEYNFSFGWKELYGLAYRGDFDLKAHQEASSKSLEYFDVENKKKFIPHVIEPSFGLDRTILAILMDAYTEENVQSSSKGMDDKEDETRIVLKLDKKIAPVKVAIFPLMKKNGLDKMAQKIVDELKENYVVVYDESNSIGKRYRKHDEIGTPYCVTVDMDSAKDKSVTVRDRDTMKQERIKIEKLKELFKSKF